MIRKSLLLFLFLFLTVSSFAQDSKPNRHRLNLGASMNIPSQPTNENYGVGFGLLQQYEFLLWSHWSVLQSLGFNNLSGKTVTEFYENKNIEVDYEHFRSVALQLGVGFYFGEGQRTFFILFKGGNAWFSAVTPAYPEVKSTAGDVVKEAIPREEENGNFWFFDPKIGWQLKRLQISVDYHGTVNNDTEINVWNIGVAYNLIKP